MSITERHPQCGHEPDTLAELATRLAEAEALASQFDAALQSNRRIGMAIGILMARQGLTEQDAFDALRKVSQRSNRKLRDVAEVVIYTGSLTG